MWVMWVYVRPTVMFAFCFNKALVWKFRLFARVILLITCGEKRQLNGLAPFIIFSVQYVKFVLEFTSYYDSSRLTID